MLLLAFAFDLPLGHSINPSLLKYQGNVPFSMGRLIYQRLYIFSLLTLNESLKIEDISIAIQEDDRAKTLLFQGQGATFFISQRKTI